MQIDIRHISLLADVMTFKGKVLGINRHGVHKMKNSTLMLASFEQTTDHLYDAAVHCKKDDITGVSECIITGNLVSLGTGAFALCHDDSAEPALDEDAAKAQPAHTPTAERQESASAPTKTKRPFIEAYALQQGPERKKNLLFDCVR